jgi:hypothetical protein
MMWAGPSGMGRYACTVGSRWTQTELIQDIYDPLFSLALTVVPIDITTWAYVFDVGNAYLNCSHVGSG